MNIKETAVTNVANLALFMINFSHALLQPFREQNSDYNILDLKSHHCGCRYASETIKRLPQRLDPILLADIYQQIAHRGTIYSVLQPSESP